MASSFSRICADMEGKKCNCICLVSLRILIPLVAEVIVPKTHLVMFVEGELTTNGLISIVSSSWWIPVDLQAPVVWLGILLIPVIWLVAQTKYSLEMIVWLLCVL